jgi:hypothetical protein
MGTIGGVSHVVTSLFIEVNLHGERSVESSTDPTDADAGATLDELIELHNVLAANVAPAKPGTILLLANEAARGGFFTRIGPVPLSRHMMIVALLSLVSVVGLSLFEDVNAKNLAEPFTGSHGMTLLKVELFLLSAAALGAAFAALFEINRYIVAGTFDTRYTTSYWTRLVLGLIAGLMLAELIPLADVSSGPMMGASDPQVASSPIATTPDGSPSPESAASNLPDVSAGVATTHSSPVFSPQGLGASQRGPDADRATLSSGSEGSGIAKVGRPLLAMIGGFSASLVYQILRRLVSSIESLVSGDPRDRMASEIHAVEAVASRRLSDAKIDVGNDLVALKEKLADGASQTEMQASISDLLHKLQGTRSRATPGGPSLASTGADPDTQESPS